MEASNNSFCSDDKHGGIQSDEHPMDQSGERNTVSVERDEGSGPSTESVGTERSVSPPPETHDSAESLDQQFVRANKRRRPRDAIKSFVDWQLRNVSRQSAEQRAYHMYLKRKIRKKASRDIAREKYEEDALRMARLAPLVIDDQGSGLRLERVDWEGDFISQDFMRLPLEAYLPRRVTRHPPILSPAEVEAALPLIQVPSVLSKKDDVPTSSDVQEQRNDNEQGNAKGSTEMP